MTNQEAIASLRTLCNTCKLFPRCAYKKPECFQAIEMAISALQAQDLQQACNKLATDTISRQAAIDAICMEWCCVKHQDCKHPFDVEKDDYYWCNGCETALRTLPDLPSAQPEIVRCKDCKHRVSYWGNCRLLEEKYHQSVLVDGDSFCSMAERRTDERTD